MLFATMEHAQSDEDLLAVGTFAINKHNGTLGMIREHRITDFGRLRIAIYKTGGKYNTELSVEQVVDNWYLLSENEYTSMLAVTEKIKDESFSDGIGMFPIRKSVVTIQPLDEDPINNSLFPRQVMVRYSYVSEEDTNFQNQPSFTPKMNTHLFGSSTLLLDEAKAATEEE